MLTLSDLQVTATQLTGSQFVLKVGPILLLKYPPGTVHLDVDEGRRTELLSNAAARNREGVRYDLSKFEVVPLPPLTPSGLVLRIGRNAANDIILEDPASSKEHATIEYAAGAGCFITDLGSMNGTSVNDRMLKPTAPELLKEGDVIRFGELSFIYYTSARMFQVLSGRR